MGAVRAGRHGGAAGLELVREAEELLGSRLPGPAGGVDLELLALVDPAGLGGDGARLAYVALCDRVAAHAAWLASRALVAVAGERPSGALMSEVAIEHEVKRPGFSGGSVLPFRRLPERCCADGSSPARLRPVFGSRWPSAVAGG